MTISGYSPYKNMGELMDPAGVEDKRDGWGVVTRLLHLDDIVDGNSPFKLYKKTDIKHFINYVAVDMLKHSGSIAQQ